MGVAARIRPGEISEGDAGLLRGALSVGFARLVYSRVWDPLPFGDRFHVEDTALASPSFNFPPVFLEDFVADSRSRLQGLGAVGMYYCHNRLRGENTTGPF